LRTLFVAACLAVLGAFGTQASECNRYAIEITTSPVIYQWTSALEKASNLLAAPPSEADTILLGDSLLAFWPRDLAESQFGKGSVWNFAVGGSRTQHILWQLEKLGATNLHPREVVVLIGTNNLTDEKLPACAIVAGIKAVVGRTHETWPGATVQVMGIPPRGFDFHFRDDARKAINDEVRRWIATLERTRYFEVDAMRMTCGRYGEAQSSLSLTPEESKSRCENYADDFGHFKRPGYEVIYSALRAEIN
jgi:lysophospholipase L1-like esterase